MELFVRIHCTKHRFEMLDQDPFWVPTTEEELEDLDIDELKDASKCEVFLG